jgi:hypothetical protein
VGQNPELAWSQFAASNHLITTNNGDKTIMNKNRSRNATDEIRL